MHDEATSTAKWLSSLSEDGIASKVWDSTIDLEIDQYAPRLTDEFEGESILAPTTIGNFKFEFDEEALMAELMQPLPGHIEDEDDDDEPEQPGNGNIKVETIENDSTTTEVSASPSIEPGTSQNAGVSEAPVNAPPVVPISSYTWQSTKQPPPFESVPEKKAQTKKAKPVIFLADNYQVVSGLGKGVMCNVFKVKDLTTGKLMVLKLLPKDLWAKSNCLDQFRHEVTAISEFQHPNLIPFRSHGFTSDGQPFLVMDYLHGITLSRAIAAGDGLPLTRVVQIFDQLCRGLAAVHEKGIPHRDIRPENVMFLSKGTDYNVKLVDFGIAKLVSQGSDPMKQLAATGEVFGNPPFMSPEECVGQKLDVRSDIYSLGCVMHMAMTGKPPFLGSSSTEILEKQKNVSLPTPSKVKPAVCKPSLAGWVTVSDLEYIVMRCLDKNPDLRYQSVQEILQDLDKLRQLLPLEKSQKTVSTFRTRELNTVPGPAPRPAKSNSALIGLVIVLVIAAAGGAYALLSANQQTQSATRVQAEGN